MAPVAERRGGKRRHTPKLTTAENANDRAGLKRPF